MNLKSDRHSNEHDLSSNKNKAWKNSGFCKGFEPMSSTILVLCMRCLLYDPKHGLSFFLSMSTSLTKNIFHFPQHTKHFNFLQIHIYHRILGKKTNTCLYLFELVLQAIAILVIMLRRKTFLQLNLQQKLPIWSSNIFADHGLPLR